MKSQSFRTVLTQQEHHMQGVPAFGRSSGTDAALPLIPHSHKDKYEIVLLSDGVRCFHADGVDYTIYENNAFFVRPNESHFADRPTKTSGELLWFQLNAEGNLLNLPQQISDFVQFKLSSCQTRLFCISPAVFSSFQESFKLLLRGDTVSYIKGQALFVYALLSLFEAPKAAQILSPDIDRAKQYIMTHLHEAIDIEQLCDQTHRSVASFSEEFERQIGFSPKEYIIQQRIALAKGLICQTDLNLDDIATRCGYLDKNTLDKLFVRHGNPSLAKYAAEHRPKKQKPTSPPRISSD